jgi:hypothetical protein
MKCKLSIYCIKISSLLQIDSYSYRPKAKKEFQSAENPDYEDIRGEANLHYRLRHDCFQKAQEAYRRGMKQVAQFYSNQVGFQYNVTRCKQR